MLREFKSIATRFLGRGDVRCERLRREPRQAGTLMGLDQDLGGTSSRAGPLPEGR